ncbi:hypothetical protein PF005_g31564 [Phytophthora fragariae]|nr:hypothetical protein PF009_g31642 [Phytophthora fragariae]KAE8958229.1 hypothetical protein PF011_g30853 [Phytophthora fragariae]KAE9057868.1 hypothetical protein PF010_g31210 [Phytophthora fragariae]KAE9160641.1 hypothetical protein PF005_g31564 [Phytophthora fragariae]KAE9161415.1 hypothetical protein PF004_g30831 [Phytophthora fragariae]
MASGGVVSVMMINSGRVDAAMLKMPAVMAATSDHKLTTFTIWNRVALELMSAYFTGNGGMVRVICNYSKDRAIRFIVSIELTPISEIGPAI